MPIPVPFAPDQHSEHPRLLVAVLGLVSLLLVGCSPKISTFNAEAYDRATTLKVESLELMDKATEPYHRYADAVRTLKTDLRKAHEFAKGRPNNEISARQWNILISADRELLGGFLRKWKEDTILSEAFVKQKKEQITEAFDTIIELESGKIKPDDVQSDS